ncbi:uncharacterized protein LOC119279327 [Triticum dicoccoides]|uniref:uncharacterized protein LOC119279327 n=1 Tax=Triticum dicoccoides TaxID=85692 RepID=UPI000E7BA10D|nr:uncharacterized protein LOC119279327 [Triticum dicoccoides]
MMASSSSSSDLSADHQLLQDDLPWPSSSLPPPLAPALHHAVGGNHHQWSQPLMLEQLSSDELEALLSAQGHQHHSTHSQLLAAPLTTNPHHQLSSLLMMQELGFQWSSSCGTADGDSNETAQDAVKEDAELPGPLVLPRPSSSSSIAYDDDMAVDVLPSVNISRLQKIPCPVAAGPFGGRAEATLEMLASAKFCKSLLSCSQASSTVLLHNGGGTAPLLGMGGHHVAYGPPPPVHRLQGPSSILHTYNKMSVPAALVSGNGSALQPAAGRSSGGGGLHDEQQLQVVAVSSKKKPRLLHSRPATNNNILPSFKVRKEKLGDRIAALQQLVSPFGKTDTASVLMEAIGYIKFLQDQVETLSGPYMRSAKHKKARTTQQRGPSDTGDQKEEAKVDLRSRGLCLVPLACTSYVTNENGIWAPPNFRGN